MGDFVVLGGINFSRIQAGQQRLVRFRVLNPGPSHMIINNISLHSRDVPFSLPHLKDASLFPIYLDPHIEFESIVAFHPTSQGKYSAKLFVTLSNARSQQINLYGECESPTSPTQILYNGRTVRTADSPLNEHGTYFDYSPKPSSPLSPTNPTPQTYPPPPTNTPATPYVKTETPYLKTDHFYTRYNHIAGRAQNVWMEGGGKDIETGPLTEVVPYQSDVAGTIISRFESRISKLEENFATLFNLVNRPQLHSDERGEKERENEERGEKERVREALDNGYPFQTPIRPGNNSDANKKSNNSNTNQTQQNMPPNDNSNFTWSTLSNQSTSSEKSNKSDKSDKSSRSSGSNKSNSMQDKKETGKNKQIHHTPYKPHQDYQFSDNSDQEFATNTKTPKSYKRNNNNNTPYKPALEYQSSEDEEGLGSSHREILGSWKKGEKGEEGEKYDDQLEVRSNSDRKYGEFEKEEDKSDEKEDKSEGIERVRSGKPIPQSFDNSGESTRDEDRINLTEEDKALLKEMEGSPSTKTNEPANWREFITATPYAKNIQNLYQNSPITNTPLPKKVHFDGYSSA